MDFGLLNGLGITLMAVFGLWAFYVAAKKSGRKKSGRGDKPAE
jgi:hypothetical protein